MGLFFFFFFCSVCSVHYIILLLLRIYYEHPERRCIPVDLNLELTAGTDVIRLQHFRPTTQSDMNEQLLRMIMMSAHPLTKKTQLVTPINNPSKTIYESVLEPIC